MHSSASYTNRRTWTRILAGCGLSTLLQTTLTVAVAQQSKAPETPAQQAKRYFDGVNKQVLEMAQDFPADKYDFRLRKEMRSFGEVIVHVMSGNFYAAKTAGSTVISLDAQLKEIEQGFFDLLEQRPRVR